MLICLETDKHATQLVMGNAVIRNLLVAVSALIAAQPSVVGAQTPDSFTSSFEEAPCPFELQGQDAAGVRCGFMTVPEDWSEPNSRAVRIAVAVLGARSQEREPEAILWAHGGPMPILVDGQMFARTAFGDTRDLILFDYRGTGRSDVICPDLGLGYLRSLGLPLSTNESLGELRRLAQDCRAWAEERDVDLGAYRSRNMAHDALATVEALGYESWHLFAGSYGTLVAFSVLRLQPEGLRSVAMMGLVPPHVEQFEVNGFARALDLMETSCGQHPECVATFPDPRAEYEALHARLEQEPLTIRVARTELFPDGTFTLGGRALQRLIFQLLYNRASLAIVPMLVRETARGNTAPMASYIDQIGLLGAGISGTSWTALCSELGARAEDFRIPERLAADEDVQRVELAAYCSTLGVRPRPAEERQPVRSDLPVLLLIGENDLATPPEYTYAAAEWLPNHHLFERLGRGHELFGCDFPVINAFFDQPTVRPEDTCPELLDSPFVTAVRVTPGIGRIARAMRGEAAPVVAGLGIPLAIMLSGTVGWPAVALVARLRRREQPADMRVDQWARIGAGAIAILALGFVSLLGWMVVRTMRENPSILMIGLPDSASLLFLLPWILLAGSIALVVATASAWRRAAWTRCGRIHFTLVTGASVAFTTTIIVWGLI